MKLLIIEDDSSVSDYVSKGLRELGHVVDVANNGCDGLFLGTTEKYDALVVDRMLPQLDGLALIRTLRGTGNATPVLILSALGEVDDRIEGLRQGGDDYVVKPFAFSEMVARIEALVRRARLQLAGSPVVTRLHAADVEMDLLRRRVTCGGAGVELKPTEFRLLEYLLQHKGQVVTRTMILEHVWSYHFDPQTNIVDVHISRLRGKIDQHRPEPLIATVRGTGYLIRE
ncbi:MAG: response regulator transcription factor [Opitutaceae bacterium]|nr:response regulator transcription factor [Opitutaceae bacterium]